MLPWIQLTPVEMTQQAAGVYPYDTYYKPLLNIPIVTGETAWGNPTKQQTYILIFQE